MTQTAVVTALILERPLCLDCIATKAGLTAAQVENLLATVAVMLMLHRETLGRCRACGEQRDVVSVERPQ